MLLTNHPGQGTLLLKGPSKALFGTVVCRSALRKSGKRLFPRFSCFPGSQFISSLIVLCAAVERASTADNLAGFFLFFPLKRITNAAPNRTYNRQLNSDPKLPMSESKPKKFTLGLLFHVSPGFFFFKYQAHA